MITLWRANLTGTDDGVSWPKVGCVGDSPPSTRISPRDRTPTWSTSCASRPFVSPTQRIIRRFIYAVSALFLAVLIVYWTGTATATSRAPEPRRPAVAAGLHLLRHGVAVDHRLRRHHPGHPVGATGQRSGDHAAAGGVPDRPDRHHRRDPHHTVAPGTEDPAMEDQSAQPHHRRRLRHQGQDAVSAMVGDDVAPADIVVVDEDPVPSNAPRARAWSPSAAVRRTRRCCGWPAPSTPSRSSSPPTATTPPSWSRSPRANSRRTPRSSPRSVRPRTNICSSSPARTRRW